MNKLTALEISRKLEVSPQTVYAWFGKDFDLAHLVYRLGELERNNAAEIDFIRSRVEAMQKLRREIEAELAVQS